MPDPSFRIRVHRWEGAAVVHAGGVLDIVTAPLLRAVLQQLIGDCSSIFVDLSEVWLLDGYTVGVLVSTHRLAGKHDEALYLCGAHGPVLRVLEIAGVDKLCDAPSGPPAAEAGQDRTVETLLAARQRYAMDDGQREVLRQLSIGAAYDLAATLARRYGGRGEPVEDLVQVAMVGLLKAVNRFDPARGKAFEAYAVPTITGEIKRHFRDKGWMVQVPRRMQEIGMELTGAREELSQRLGRAPTLAEVAAYLELAEDDVVEAVSAAQVYRPGSLSASVHVEGFDTDVALGDLIGGVDDGFELVDNRASLRALVRQLSLREQRILALRFYGDRTQSQIADELGISQMHVSRLLNRALCRLRQGLID